MTVYQQHTALHRQHGMSIVEIMVALVISLMLLAGVVQIFVSSKATYRTQEALSRLQENARFAIDFVNRRTRLAGYMGCLSSNTSALNSQLKKDPLTGDSLFGFDLGKAIEGFEAAGTNAGDTYTITATNPAPSSSSTAWSPNLHPDLVGKVLPGSDVLVVRNASTNSYPLVSPFNDSAQVFVKKPNDFANGEVLIATDCVKSTLFQATNVKDGTGVDMSNVVHSGNTTYVPGNISPTWPAGQSYGAGAELMRAETTVYYIGAGASGVPTLFQRQLSRVSDTETALVSQELVEGVEGMQIVYGEDTNADGTADGYVSADAVGVWTNVVSVRIAFLLRSEERVRTDADSGTYNVAGTTVDPVNDRRLREVATTTVALRNRVK